MNAIPNEHNPESHNLEWTRSRMDTILNGHDPQCALTFI